MLLISSSSADVVEAVDFFRAILPPPEFSELGDPGEAILDEPGEKTGLNWSS